MTKKISIEPINLVLGSFLEKCKCENEIKDFEYNINFDLNIVGKILFSNDNMFDIISNKEYDSHIWAAPQVIENNKGHCFKEQVECITCKDMAIVLACHLHLNNRLILCGINKYCI